ncbi:IRK-interacting protein-like [Impatiens glandulifera]|uniref:IRK-interacting protein-like n=1 Tax=Impatiens glandulifera TaxID=253017 RepID=UPI001FB1319E|nr:IRK-interacting protein-like [Impatiens glandulifera]
MAEIIENGQEISREEVQAAIAKAIELRALHAALMQGSINSPANFSFPASSPAAAPYLAPQFSAHDYPVFTPSYEDDEQLQFENNRAISESWNVNGEENSINSYSKMFDSPSNKRLLPHVCPSSAAADDQKSVANSCSTNLHRRISSCHSHDFCNHHPTRRNSLGEVIRPATYSSSSCNKCNPATISIQNSKSVGPMTDSHLSVKTRQKNRGLMNLSWLFLKKKNKKDCASPNRTTESNIPSVEELMNELQEAKENRDAAVKEVSGMKTSIRELKLKLEYLETYCEELKKALRQAVETKELSIDGKLENPSMMPVSDEVMVEGFLQIVSETRSSVKQFCKTLITQIDETDGNLMNNLNNNLLQPYKLSLTSKYSKGFLYHLECMINEALYEDFENCMFQKNGCRNILNPEQHRQAQFSSFVALRNLSWNEVLRKGTKFYSEEFSRFCDQKMVGIIAGLSWSRPWPEQLLQSFFVAAKCVWLLHLLAFSFGPPVGILRVEENKVFDGNYMEDVFVDKKRLNGAGRVKVMVMPGFYVQDRVLRCKVICRYKSLT